MNETATSHKHGASVSRECRAASDSQQPVSSHTHREREREARPQPVTASQCCPSLATSLHQPTAVSRQASCADVLASQTLLSTLCRKWLGSLTLEHTLERSLEHTLEHGYSVHCVGSGSALSHWNTHWNAHWNTVTQYTV